jgi:hypothetical protein
VTALQLLRQKIREQQDSYKDSLTGGTARDFAEYSHHVGIIAGLDMALRELVEIELLLEKGEE